MRSYDETVAWLQQLEVTAGWDLKLERMRAALALRGHPERAYPAVHIAGTNGKGSTAAMVEAALRAAGRRTGLYTSPHLVDFAERIRAGGRTIPHAAVIEVVAELRAALDGRALALTHFEFVTLLAFEWFARIGVDAAVVEVGLGGRLDATNTVSPVATAVTSIAHDHEAWLGHELAQIAREKAGIAKPGVPLALGRLPPEAESVIRAHAMAVGAPVVQAGRDGWLEAGGFRAPDGTVTGDLAVGLAGAFQVRNAEVALLLCWLLRERFGVAPAAVRAGLSGVSWPGRLALVSEAPRVVIDGAHNPASAAVLAAELPWLVGERRRVLLFAVMADKAWRAMLESLLPGVAQVVVTRVGGRGLDPAVVAEAVSGRVPVHLVPDPRDAVGDACARAGGDGAVVVAGSLFLAGIAYAELLPEARLFEPWRGWSE